MIKIKNWDRFQHFKDRRPPWIKLHREMLDSLDINMISDRSFRVLINIWLLASEDKDKEGKIPGIADIAFRLRMDKDKISKAIQELAPFLINDDIKVISEQYQLDAPETETETETYSEELEKKDSSLYFEEFWKSWIPYKTGKGPKVDAKEIYLKITKEIDHETIIRIAREYCKFCETTDCNTKNVFRWLRKRGWEDDYTIPARGVPKQSQSERNLEGLREWVES